MSPGPGGVDLMGTARNVTSGKMILLLDRPSIGLPVLTDNRIVLRLIKVD